jgi:hypothetical protein
MRYILYGLRVILEVITLGFLEFCYMALYLRDADAFRETAIISQRYQVIIDSAGNINLLAKIFVAFRSVERVRSHFLLRLLTKE